MFQSLQVQFHEKPMNVLYLRFKHSTWHLSQVMSLFNVLLLVVFGAYPFPPYFARTKISGVRYFASMKHLTLEFITGALPIISA